MNVAVGFVVQPEAQWLERCRPCFDRVDLLEVTPETLWRPDDAPGFRPNGYFRGVADLQQRLGVPVVAHGVGLSMGSVDPGDRGRRAGWLERVAGLHEALRFGWYTEHSGATTLGGRNLVLPIPVPAVGPVARALRQRLDDMATIVGLAGVENSAFPFPLSTGADEADLLVHALGDDHALLLDLHNLYVHAVNDGLDVAAWLDRAPLDRVVEIHVSGGTDSDPSWLVSGAKQRLDSHDGPVPEPVWALLEAVLPRCGGLRAVVLERMEGTVQPGDVGELVASLDRIRACIARAQRCPDGVRCPPPLAEVDEAAVLRFEQSVAAALCDVDPVSALRRLPADTPAALGDAAAHALSRPDGARIGALLIAKLRFERLLQGDREVDAWFENEPAAFTARFRSYHHAVPPIAWSPRAEALAFARFCDGATGPLGD